MTIQCFITCLLYKQKNRHFYSFYLTNEHQFLFGGHLEFLNLKINMTIQCVITCLLYKQKTRHFYSFYLTNEHHFLFGGHLEFLNLKSNYGHSTASSIIYYINKKPDNSILFISKTSITSCLAAILIFEIGETYCILFVTMQNP